jgi:hypothetical protein
MKFRSARGDTVFIEFNVEFFSGLSFPFSSKLLYEESQATESVSVFSLNFSITHAGGPINIALKETPLMYRARICKPFKEPRNRFPAWPAGTTTLLVVTVRQAT